MLVNINYLHVIFLSQKVAIESAFVNKTKYIVKSSKLSDKEKYIPTVQSNAHNYMLFIMYKTS